MHLVYSGSMKQLENFVAMAVVEYRDLFGANTYSFGIEPVSCYPATEGTVKGTLWRERFGEQALKETFSFPIVFCSFFPVSPVAC